MSGFAKQVFEAQNLFRQDPLKLVKILEDTLPYFKGKVINFPGSSCGLMTNEGPAAYKEAITFLKSAKPLPALKYSQSLAKAALDHAKDIGPSGVIGHTGADGSSMTQRIQRYCSWSGTIGQNISFGDNSAERVIAQLVVDDGVPSRGHRKNIFNPAFKQVGIGSADHKAYKMSVVFDYAGGVGEKGSSAQTGPAPSAMSSSSAKSKLDKELQDYKMGKDQHAPADAVSSSVSMSSKSSGGKVTKTLVKKYKLKGGGQKTITLTQTIG